LYTEADWLRFNKLYTDKIVYSLGNFHNNIIRYDRKDYLGPLTLKNNPKDNQKCYYI